MIEYLLEKMSTVLLADITDRDGYYPEVKNEYDNNKDVYRALEEYEKELPDQLEEWITPPRVRGR